MRILIAGGRMVNEGRISAASLVIEDEIIAEIRPASAADESAFDQVIDATGCYILPGVIDEHVHFREPGLTNKADIDSESRAAAAGGVTSYFDMPNNVPTTTTLQALEEKFALASQSSHVNYSFFFGATHDNAELFSQLDVHAIPGVKLFMGSSTGNMLVDGDEALERVFRLSPLPIMAHCEDTNIINKNMALAQQGHGDDPEVQLHSLIRSEEACLKSTQKAIALARKHHARLHVAHLSTAEEVELFEPVPSINSQKPMPLITAEVAVGHLLFSMLDYPRLGTRIKVNPSVKSPVDQFVLRQALTDGRIATVATDHAPHLLSQKQGGCRQAASGMPMIQYALPAMLELVDQGVLTPERAVELMAHNPARLFQVRQRGFLRPGYKADVVIVRPRSPWTVAPQHIESKCQWSPLEGHQFQWRVEQTFCNGHLIYNKGVVDSHYIAQPLSFR